MNPDSNRLEHLKLLDDLKTLLRPDGTPVPRHWTVLTVGEYVAIKGYTFKVAHIGESHLLLEPVGIIDLGAHGREG